MIVGVPDSLVQVLDSEEAVAMAAAACVWEHAARAIRLRGRFVVALAGGETPRRLYRELAVADPPRLPWRQVHLFWGDERLVPATHPDSNYGMARAALLDHVDIPPENVHAVPVALPPMDAAREYERTIRMVTETRAGDWPRFDLVLLGLGSDGHTASLFPETEALEEAQRVVVANWVPRLGAYRVTLTLPALAASAAVLFVVTGPSKAEAVLDVLRALPELPPLPAARVRPVDGRVTWLLDRAAARLLERNPPPSLRLLE